MSEPENCERPQAVAVTRPEGEILPLIFDSPHSGRVYPDDFMPAADKHLLTGGEDRFVDDLILDVPSHGVTLIKALFARTYIDPNRAEDDLDPKLLPEDWAEATAPSVNSERGVGLIFRLIGDEHPIYDRKLTAGEIRERIEHYWRPYHETLQNEADLLHERFGEVFLVNCHSMQPVGNALAPDPGAVRADFVLGDLDGHSCDAEFTRFVEQALTGLGYSVAINEPYRGALIVERHGDPAQNRHSLQIEINRGLYMDHGTLDRSGGFKTLKEDLTRFAHQVADFVRQRAA